MTHEPPNTIGIDIEGVGSINYDVIYGTPYACRDCGRNTRMRAYFIATDCTECADLTDVPMGEFCRTGCTGNPLNPKENL